MQDKILYHKMDPGIILSNLSLVIQNVRRDHAGTYFCLATNAHGNGSSNPVQLNVQCEYSTAQLEQNPITIGLDQIEAPLKFKHLLVKISHMTWMLKFQLSINLS